ncbi:hypothetical protein [Streptomyces sp. bgisy104]|uniref:hypothetical protein n=1 Tax=Streptomyces sp. bgisy104 TaxID=3413785 RepID=UPI003EBF1C48
MDEPTSALDPAAEQRGFDQIHRLAGTGQTTVLITHRLHSVRHTDLIDVLDAGRVVEQDTFERLMDPATGTGAFRTAYELQARQFTSPSAPTRPVAPPEAGSSARPVTPPEAIPSTRPVPPPEADGSATPLGEGKTSS